MKHRLTIEFPFLPHRESVEKLVLPVIDVYKGRVDVTILPGKAIFESTCPIVLKKIKSRLLGIGYVVEEW